MVLIFPIQNITAQSNEIENFFDMGIESFQSGNYNESISFFDKVLEIDPNHVDALNNKGNALAELGELEKSISFFDKVLEIEPNHVGALNNKGSVIAELGELEKSISFFDKVLEIEPNHVDALNNRARVMVETEQYINAVMDYERLIIIDPQNTLLKQKQLYAYNKIPYDFIDGNVYIEIRNSDGWLVALLKSQNQFKILGNEDGNNYLGNQSSQELITKDGKDYEVIQKDYVRISSDNVVQGRSGIFAEEISIPVIIISFWGFMTEKGDIITTIYTIFRPVE